MNQNKTGFFKGQFLFSQSQQSENFYSANHTNHRLAG